MSAIFKDNSKVESLKYDDLVMSRSAYVSESYDFILDSQNGNYNSEVAFDIKNISGCFDLSQGWIDLPFTVAPTTDSYTGGSSMLTEIAPKSSLLGLISTIRVESNGTTLLDENSGALFLKNQFRSHLELDEIEKFQASFENYQGIDEAVSSTNPSQYPISMPTRNISGAGVYNPALSRRANYMNRYFNATSGKYECIAHLKLRHIHPFFAKLDPTYSADYRITFGLAHKTTLYQPFVYGLNSSNVSAPVVNIGGLSGVVDGQNISSCQLWYSHPVLNA
mgnify:CR=1 FL=1